MRTWITGGQVYIAGHMENTGLVLKDGKVEGFCSSPAPGEKDQVYDAAGAYVVPGFIDIHTHGGFGIDVNAACKDDFETIGHFFCYPGNYIMALFHIDRYPGADDEMYREALAHMGDHKNCASLMGIHLEGPFLSSEYKAPCREYLLKTPDLALVEKYQQAAQGNIRYMTVSPEVAGVPKAIPDIKDLGIAVAIGHSGADYETAWRCIRNGAVAGTHVMNAMKLMHQHFPGIMGALLESDAYCEAICDGRHLHPGTVRFLIKVKGMDRMVAITDSIMAAGLPDGNYKLGVNDVIVTDGDAKLKDGTRAGSTLTTGQALKNVIRFTGKTLAQVLPMFTINPAKVVGADRKVGSLEPGKDGDVVILDQNFSVKDTFIKGEKIIKRR